MCTSHCEPISDFGQYQSRQAICFLDSFKLDKKVPTCFCFCCLSCFDPSSLCLDFASVIASVSGYKSFHSNKAIIGAVHTFLYNYYFM